MKSIRSIIIRSFNQVTHLTLPCDSEIIKFDFVDGVSRIWYWYDSYASLEERHVYIINDRTGVVENYELEYIGSSKDATEKMWHAFEILNYESATEARLNIIKLL